MKRIITIITAIIIVSGAIAQNPKVAIFDLNQADSEFLINDVRYTYYDEVFSFGKLDAIDIEKIYPVLEEKNYNSDNDPDYQEAIKIAQEFGADLILIPRLEIYKKSTYIFRNYLVDVKTGDVVAKGEKTHHYKQFAYEQALDNLLADYSSNVTTTPSYDEAEKDQNFSVTIGDIAFEMIYVEGGTFAMGSDKYRNGKFEKPVHDVTLDSYYIGKTEVTFELFDAFCEETGEQKPDSDDWNRGKNPVINVGRPIALRFCEWLSKKTGMNYRLPTEAEWEYAARGGIKRPAEPTNYAGSNSLFQYGWYDRNSQGTTHPVGLKLPNELGIHDMCGNVVEICNDWFDPNYYKNSPTHNPQGPKKGKGFVLRGGSYIDCGNVTRLTYRQLGGISRRACDSNLVGFRVVCDVKD